MGIAAQHKPFLWISAVQSSHLWSGLPAPGLLELFTIQVHLSLVAVRLEMWTLLRRVPWTLQCPDLIRVTAPEQVHRIFQWTRKYTRNSCTFIVYTLINYTAA